MIYKIYSKIKRILFPKPIIKRVVEFNTYSQAGEDAVLSFLFSDKKIDQISYLDVGTNSPIYGNNTYLFYKKGSRGVCVEADKSLIPAILEARPEDKVVNAGVAVGEWSEADFYIFDVSALNTFNKREAENRQSFGTYKIKEIVRVPLVGINTIIKDNFQRYPDLLSIDIEGLDLEVLQSLDYGKYPIPVICVETCRYSENHIRPKEAPIIDFLISKGYDVYADTYINTIFVRKDWFAISNNADVSSKSASHFK